MIIPKIPNIADQEEQKHQTILNRKNLDYKDFECQFD